MHEQSETVQLPNGRWVNVYGRATAQAGKQLPGSSDYATVDEAVAAAKARSTAAAGIADALKIDNRNQPRNLP